MDYQLDKGSGSPPVRAAVLPFGPGALLHLPTSSDISSVPETQAVNAAGTPFSLYFVSPISRSFIVVTASHHGARRAFFMLFLASRISSLSDEQMMKHGMCLTDNDKTKTLEIKSFL